MTCGELLFRGSLGIAAIAHNNFVIFGPKFRQRHRLPLFMKAEGKPIYDMDIGQIEPIELFDRVKTCFPKIRAAHIIKNAVG
jgi:hypothetical protein